MKTDWRQSQHEIGWALFQSWNIINLQLQQAVFNYQTANNHLNKKYWIQLDRLSVGTLLHHCVATELQVGQMRASTQGQRVAARWPELVKWDTGNLRVLLKRLSCKDPATMEKSHRAAISTCICWWHLSAATRQSRLDSWGGRNEGDKHLRSWEPPSPFPPWTTALLRNCLVRQRPFLFSLFPQKCGKRVNTWQADGA